VKDVAVKPLKKIKDARGWLAELLRKDWPEFKTFAQAYLTTVYPGVVKAWHCHQKQTDNFVCVKGKVKLVLYLGPVNYAAIRHKNQAGEFLSAQKVAFEKFRRNYERALKKNGRQALTFILDEKKLQLIRIPPYTWHGFKGMGSELSFVINFPTQLYNYDSPDELRLSPERKKSGINFNWRLTPGLAHG